ncbi:hypothetical protein ID866_6492 [Astraeus odoratus]|nr:hypothetical protein ID866_6492 [Astraeus odoratus]
MPERRNGRAARCTKPAGQTSLRDHFQRNSPTDAHGSSVAQADVNIVPRSPEVVHIDVDEVISVFPPADSGTQSSQEARPKKLIYVTTKQGALILRQTRNLPPWNAGSSSDRLFPIFTKTRRQKAPVDIIDVDGDEAHTAAPECELSDAELPPLSSYHASPRSDVTPCSRASSPFTSTSSLRASRTSSPVSDPTEAHTATSTGLPGPRKKPSPTRRSGRSSANVAPLPDGESQHVRGPQHSYSAMRAPLRARSYSCSRSVCHGYSLDFLVKHEPDPVSDASQAQFRDKLCSYRQEEGLPSTSQDPGVPGAAISEPVPFLPTNSISTEMWTCRFRPKRAEEVLGNENHALYLRNWLRALELHLQDKQTAGAGPTQNQGILKKQTGKCDLAASQPRGEKRPRVIRAVVKTKGRKKRRFDSDDELDDFIVCSDRDEGDKSDVDVCDELEDEFAFCQQTLSRICQMERGSSHNPTPPDAEPPSDGNLCMLSDVNNPLEGTFLTDSLTNTLLITGPPGCGKTAAVYACAEELGWDVFEVYPGIGRRTGANLDYLVGDVGKNHIIQVAQERSSQSSARAGKQSSSTLVALFSKRRTGAPPTGGSKSGTEGDPISIEDRRPSNAMNTENKPSLPPEKSSAETGSHLPRPITVDPQPAVRQSLVLLEEVDILFKEDTGFWPAVVDLIRDCKRPVVMTCNDLRLVPVGSLPLQTILVFEPCPSPVAVSYLQSVTLTEGCLVPRERLMELYETTHVVDGIDMPESPLYPRTEPLPLPDLRRAITQLQMLCSSMARGSTSDMLQGTREAGGHVRRSAHTISAESNATRLPSATEWQRWRRMGKHADLLSFVNSNLCRSPLHTPEALSFTGSEPTLDDELGHSMLFVDGRVLDTRQGLAFYRQDELIAQDAIQLSRGIHEELVTDPTVTSINPAASLTREETEIFRSRVVYQSQIADALRRIVQPPAPLMPQSSVFLDYLPWVRYMVMVDDDLERMAQEEIERGRTGRMTRNSMRTRHIRNIDLEERERETLARTRLAMDE